MVVVVLVAYTQSGTLLAGGWGAGGSRFRLAVHATLCPPGYYSDPLSVGVLQCLHKRTCMQGWYRAFIGKGIPSVFVIFPAKSI